MVRVFSVSLVIVHSRSIPASPCYSGDLALSVNLHIVRCVGTVSAARDLACPVCRSAQKCLGHLVPIMELARRHYSFGDVRSRLRDGRPSFVSSWSETRGGVPDSIR